MDSVQLRGAVGASPAANMMVDVKAVQGLLVKVAPALRQRVTVSGVADHATLEAIREFQSRFMSYPDRRVDVDGRTLWHLNEGFVSRYVHCSAHQRKVLDHDLMRAADWLRTTVAAINGNLVEGVKGKVKNIFHIDANQAGDRGKMSDLIDRFTRLKSSFNEPFPLQCHNETSIFGAWVVPGDPEGTIHFPSNYFDGGVAERTEKLVHERSHTLFHIEHAGMHGAGSVEGGMAADDENGFSYDQAIANAYCYGWLAQAVQPGYVPDRGEIVITPRHRRH